MAIVINGSGTVTGLAVGGLPDGTVDAGTVAADVATQAEIDAKLNLAGGTMTGNLLVESSASASTVVRSKGTAADGYRHGFEAVNGHTGGETWSMFSTNNSDGNHGGGKFVVAKAAIGSASVGSLVIDSTGAVTKPNQPAFLATANGSSQTNVGGAETVNFGTEVFDQNSDYNTSTHTFTAPVTGRYNLAGTVRTGELATDANFYRIEIQTSNRNYKFEIIDPDKLYSANPSYHSFHFNSLADMDSGDTASVVLIRNGGTASLDITGSPDYTFWSGYLVC